MISAFFMSVGNLNMARGQVVKTPPFHGGFMGSNPIRVTMVIQLLIKSFYIDLRMLFKVQIKNLDFKKHFFIF